MIILNLINQWIMDYIQKIDHRAILQMNFSKMVETSITTLITDSFKITCQVKDLLTYKWTQLVSLEEMIDKVHNKSETEWPLEQVKSSVTLVMMHVLQQCGQKKSKLFGREIQIKKIALTIYNDIYYNIL